MTVTPGTPAPGPGPAAVAPGLTSPQRAHHGPRARPLRREHQSQAGRGAGRGGAEGWRLPAHPGTPRGASGHAPGRSCQSPAGRGGDGMGGASAAAERSCGVAVLEAGRSVCWCPCARQPWFCPRAVCAALGAPRRPVPPGPAMYTPSAAWGGTLGALRARDCTRAGARRVRDARFTLPERAWLAVQAGSRAPGPHRPPAPTSDSTPSRRRTCADTLPEGTLEPCQCPAACHQACHQPPEVPEQRDHLRSHHHSDKGILLCLCKRRDHHDNRINYSLLKPNSLPCLQWKAHTRVCAACFFQR